MKVARPVWRGVVEKGLAHDITCDHEQVDLRYDTVPRQLPTLQKCLYFGITDALIHALVGDGKHGRAERIQTFRC